MPKPIASDGGSKLDILSFETLPSTQVYLVDRIRRGEITQPVAVIAEEQTAGQGSRHNTWEGGRGNLFTSIAVKAASLPEDLLPQSASIYFAYLFKEILYEIDPSVRLKWPNDLYLGEDKIGGVMTQKLKDCFVVGIGVNLKKNRNSFSALNTDISALILLNIFLKRLEKYPKWKDLFSKFKVEFEFSRAHFAHQNGARISLQDAVLCDDGSLEINGERMYSLR